MTAGDEAMWDLYAGARIDCTIDGRARRLRGPDAEPLPAPAPIFVLTAYNPGGVERDRALNDAAEEELESRLASAGTTFWPARGRSPDASWSEPGVAVAGFDRAQACELGRRYGQLAVYELTEHEVHVVQCFDGAVVRTRVRGE